MDIEELTRRITQEVICTLGSQGPTLVTCTSSDGTSCTGCGYCVTNNPDAIKRIISNGASRISSRLGVPPPPDPVARMIDHTLLKANATEKQVGQLCEEARRYHFMSVCINPTWVEFSARLLRRSDVKVCTVIGFPLGASTPDVKGFETRNAIGNGAQEVDMVINVGALKSGEYDLVEDDIRAVVRAARQTVITKVILETCYLTDEEKVTACEIAKRSGADFVKTSTGFGTGGATTADIALMRKTVGAEMGVKASGGVRTPEDAKTMIEAGATRIGASASVKIVGGKGAKGDDY